MINIFVSLKAAGKMIILLLRLQLRNDRLPLARLQVPPLSSIEQPRRRIGYEAADLLCKLISGKIGKTVNLRLPVELHERESTIGKHE